MESRVVEAKKGGRTSAAAAAFLRASMAAGSLLTLFALPAPPAPPPSSVRPSDWGTLALGFDGAGAALTTWPGEEKLSFLDILPHRPPIIDIVVSLIDVTRR